MTKDKDRTPVAQNVATMCTKCKIVLNHVVILHNAQGIVDRAKCLTCGSEHKYRPERKKTPAKTANKKATTRKKVIAIDYEKLAEQFQNKESLPYSMSSSFEKEDVVAHQTFGRGFVLSVSHQRMEVAFSGGPRTLACNR
ncbi:MAG: hypothetical protein JRJ82_10200 [Deltaproteobacteria bacterium]|nr:hypothetical protein [Deltaproteobacteria bacterium]